MIETINTYFLYSLIGYALFVLLPYITLASIKSLKIYQIDETKKVIDTSSLKYEVIGTLLSFMMIYLIICLGVSLESNGLTLLRDEIRNVPLYILSFIAVVLLHDAYFYFTHLMMHKNKTLLRFHLWHHKAKNPTPLSVLSFHPVEGFIHFIFFILLCYLPIHISIIGLFYIWMLVCNAFGHMNFEFYTSKIQKFKLTRNFNTATHHYMHHRYFNKNFGIYYNHWDKLFKTNHKDYLKSFIQTRLKIRNFTLREQKR